MTSANARVAANVVLASAGYPSSSSRGDVIGGLEEAAALDGVEITHAGTALSGGEVVTAGGRVLNVTGLGTSAADARRRAYDAADRISFEGKQMRTDIGSRAVARAAAAKQSVRWDRDDRRDGLKRGRDGPPGPRSAGAR